MNKSNVVIIFLVIVAVIVAGYYLLPNKTAPEEDVTEDTTEEEPIEEFVTYKIEFVADWSEITHPNNYPDGAHFSPFIAYSHNNSNEAKIFALEQLPSRGIEEMAETGGTGPLNEEIDEIINSGFAFKKTQGGVFDSPGLNSAELEFNSGYSHITFVSMLAPSPDWFVSGSVNLIKDSEWADTIELNLTTYDAGSDSGKELTSQDLDTNPKEQVTVFDESLQGLGKVILTRIKK